MGGEKSRALHNAPIGGERDSTVPHRLRQKAARPSACDTTSSESAYNSRSLIMQEDQQNGNYAFLATVTIVVVWRIRQSCTFRELQQFKQFAWSIPTKWKDLSVRSGSFTAERFASCTAWQHTSREKFLRAGNLPHSRRIYGVQVTC